MGKRQRLLSELRVYHLAAWKTAGASVKAIVYVECGIGVLVFGASHTPLADWFPAWLQDIHTAWIAAAAFFIALQAVAMSDLAHHRAMLAQIGNETRRREIGQELSQWLKKGREIGKESQTAHQGSVNEWIAKARSWHNETKAAIALLVSEHESEVFSTATDPNVSFVRPGTVGMPHENMVPAFDCHLRNLADLLKRIDTVSIESSGLSPSRQVVSDPPAAS